MWHGRRICQISVHFFSYKGGRLRGERRLLSSLAVYKVSPYSHTVFVWDKGTFALMTMCFLAGLQEKKSRVFLVEKSFVNFKLDINTGLVLGPIPLDTLHIF